MIFGCAILVPAMSASAQLRIVNYNTLDKPVGLAEESQFQTIFAAIAAESVNGIARPVDILTLQEQQVSSGVNTAVDIAAALNSLHGTTAYQALVIGSGYDRLSTVYNSETVDVLDNRLVGVGVRPAMRTQFRPVGYSDPGSDFYVYSAHLKAGSSSSDESQRDSEVANLRSNADALGAEQNVIYSGDFNIGSGSEAAYQGFFTSGNASAVDPTGVSSWNGFATPEIMTQSTRSGTLSDGGSGSGMDDRFDFQLVSEQVADGSGFAIITPDSTGAASSSYRAFGNDGTSYNQSINNTYTGRSQSASVLDALYQFSDHLPVVADYQLPAKLELAASVTADQAFVGSGQVLIAGVDNTAPVTVNNGADAMQYSVTATGDLAEFNVYGGTLQANDNPAQHVWVIDTAIAGQKNATIEYTSLSDGVADTQVGASMTVYDHATASLDDSAAITSLTIDFGSIVQGSNDGLVGEAFSIFNLESTPGYTSALSVGSWSAFSGDTDALGVLELPGEVTAGGSLLQVAALDTSATGFFESTWQISVTDALDAPGALSETLTLTLVAEVISDLLVGDFDSSGAVGSGDLALVLSYWGMTVADGQAPGLDWANPQGVTASNIGSDELALVLSNWGNTLAIEGALYDISSVTGLSQDEVWALVPEPGSLALLGVLLVLGVPQRNSLRSRQTPRM